MKKHANIMGMYLVGCLLVVGLIACGGGGGDSATSNTITYSGTVTPATLDGTNAVSIVTSAYQGSSTGGALGGLGAVAAGSDEPDGSNQAVSMARAFKSILEQVDVNVPATEIGVVQTAQATLYGNCAGGGGSAVYSISYDDVSGVFSGSFSFNNYCAEGMTFSGAASFSGQIDVGTANFIGFNFSFAALTTASATGSYTIQGSCAYDFSTMPMTVDMNLLMRDNSQGIVLKIANYSLTLTEAGGYVDIAIVSGQFYNPDYGYVSIYTTTALRINTGDQWPSDGVLICTGADGSAGGATAAKLTVISSSQYQVEVDTNGDGSYDFNTGPQSWADL